ncbi:MAG: MBL fold metallo-hydrolase [Clostridia bacterium]
MRRLFLLFLLLWLCAPPAAAAVYTGDQPPKADWYQRPLLRLTVFDCGQNDCMLLQAGGQSMMIDGGSATWHEKLYAALDTRGLKHLKYLLNTHYHEDHLGGLYQLIKSGITADEYLHPYAPSALKKSSLHADTISLAASLGIPTRQLQNGEELLLGEAVITVYRYEEGRGVNGKSMIEHVRFGNATMLLTADIIGVTQHYFATALPKDVLKVDVLKAPHHGITPLVKAFLTAASPAVEIVTSGAQAVPRTAIQAQANGIQAFFSGDGTVVLETDGDDWYIQQSPNNLW